MAGISFATAGITSGTSPYAAWEASFTPPAIHPIPAIEPFDALYQFGWERLRAGVTMVRLNKGGEWIVHDYGERWIPLRAEVDVFIGSVFCELSAIAPPL